LRPILCDEDNIARILCTASALVCGSVL